jgi:hypothetical protein
MSYQTETLADSPVGFWRLGEASGTTAADASGNGRDGTYLPNSGGAWTGGTQGASGALAGDADTAATFDGSSGYVKRSAWSPVAGGSYTYEAWIKTTSVAEGFFFGEGRSDDTGHWSYLILLAGGKIRHFNVDTGLFIDGAAVVNDGGWHHVAVTFNSGTGSGQLYVDGATDGSPASASAAASSADQVGVGALVRSDVVNYFAGAVDECAIYSTALSAARILAHYNAGITAAASGKPWVYAHLLNNVGGM